MYAIVSYFPGNARDAELFMVETIGTKNLNQNTHLTLVNALRSTGRRVAYKQCRKGMDEAANFLLAIRGG